MPADRQGSPRDAAAWPQVCTQLPPLQPSQTGHGGGYVGGEGSGLPRLILVPVSPETPLQPRQVQQLCLQTGGGGG